MIAIIQTGAHRVDTPQGIHFYAPVISTYGRMLHLKKLQATKTEAEKYAKRFSQKYKGICK